MTSPLYENKGLLHNTQTALNVFADSFPAAAAELRLTFKVYKTRSEMPPLDRFMNSNEQQTAQPTEVCLYLDRPKPSIRKLIVSCSEPLNVFPAEIPKNVQIITEGSAVLVD